MLDDDEKFKCFISISVSLVSPCLWLKVFLVYMSFDLFLSLSLFGSLGLALSGFVAPLLIHALTFNLRFLLYRSLSLSHSSTFLLAHVSYYSYLVLGAVDLLA